MQQRSEETRARILESAQNLFSRYGYEATSVSDICAAAGISKGAFYHHFTTKHQVFDGLLQKWLQSVDARLSSIRQGSQNAAGTLIEMAAMMKDVFQATDGRLSMFLEFWTHSSRDPACWDAAVAPYHRYQQVFASLVEEGIHQGVFRPVNPDTASRVILAMALGTLAQGLLDPGGAAWEQVTLQAIQYLVTGLSQTEAA